ncbi:hypothetical protein FYM55_11090 [Staphylococcus aureus]|nr:hypothetical protein FYM42_10635 [Staphylococcus aureus]TYO44756.1 hypothetical protein FYM55_11090 [Staphylococcus aureus]TYO56706.1 hypothetical protein FYM51_04980 [Staphylococcus aureus]
MTLAFPYNSLRGAFYVIITCIYSRSELYSPAEAIYLTVGPAGDFFLAITRYIYLDNIELL